ncbi:hypothetical protein [Bradyrhizobium sp. UFLA05-112]
MSGVASAVLIHEITSSTEAPSHALAVLQYVLLAGGLIGLVGSSLMHAQEK